MANGIKDAKNKMRSILIAFVGLLKRCRSVTDAIPAIGEIILSRNHSQLGKIGSTNGHQLKYGNHLSQRDMEETRKTIPNANENF